jgi:AcrR family transcriptional regulator
MAIDHNERRDRIAEVAIEIIAQEGLEAATIRRIAAEMGASIRVITHYFADKDELLFSVYRTMAEQGQTRIMEAIASDPADLMAGLLAMTAMDKSAFQRWRVYVSFWDRAARDPVFAAEQHKWVEHTIDTVAGMISARHGAVAEVRSIALRLLAFVQGISVQRLCSPASWSPQEIEAAIAQQVAVLLSTDIAKPLGT